MYPSNTTLIRLKTDTGQTYVITLDLSQSVPVILSCHVFEPRRVLGRPCNISTLPDPQKRELRNIVSNELL